MTYAIKFSDGQFLDKRNFYRVNDLQFAKTFDFFGDALLEAIHIRKNEDKNAEIVEL